MPLSIQTQINAAISAAAAGDGSPKKYFFSDISNFVLNLARRKAAQAQ